MTAGELTRRLDDGNLLAILAASPSDGFSAWEIAEIAVAPEMPDGFTVWTIREKLASYERLGLVRRKATRARGQRGKSSGEGEPERYVPAFR